MIAKDLHSCSSSDPKTRLRHAAQVQLAAYLAREFHDNPQVWVFNGLQFEHRGVTTQIDHLLLTTWGFFIVESQSIIVDTRVNLRGEWTCRNDDSWVTMPSPLEQAQSQMHQLRRLLDDNAEQLLGKLLGWQKRFSGFEGKDFCAVNDQASLARAQPRQFLEAMPANRVARAITHVLDEFKRRTVLKAAFAFGRDPVLRFTPEDLVRTKDFLIKCDGESR